MLSSSAEEAVLLLLLWGGAFTTLSFARARHLPELLWQLGVATGGAVLLVASLLLAIRGGSSFVGGSTVVVAALALLLAGQVAFLARAWRAWRRRKKAGGSGALAQPALGAGKQDREGGERRGPG